ncbi:MFS family permease [Actinoplanes lutulentus]|uniref:Putative MFS family arabinose efflux permease n=1 Tax=Actinoplanes lutulentus TaxID=1287878 RepID=A0A327ZDA9_9ACTN|nr:MFS transporter [Actinoplanes lutulentus]MBB2947443.1 MFS family permease [Actinoplanes lutulentus]RAK36716.1 putative MFS family arabinose efflux permease [Actinoplanes lutulentus]
MAITEESEQIKQVTAYPGRPPVAVRRGTAAPFGWWPAICVALVAAIDRIEYNLLAGALPTIQEEFGFSDSQGGAIATAGALAAIVLLLPAGKLADTGKRTWTISAVVAVWALLTVGTGLAGTYATLFAVRVLLGAAGQLYNPPSSSLLGDLYPGPGRARAYGYERMAYFAGLPIGVIAGGALAQTVGWRTGFFLVAVPGVIIALLVLTVREPVRGVGDGLSRWYSGGSSAPAASVVEPAAPMRVQLAILLRIRTLRSVIVGLSILFFGLGGLFFWMPSFYTREFGLAEASAAAVGGGAGLVGIVGGILAGSWLGDRLHERRVAIGGWALLFGTVFLAGAISVPVLVPQAICFTLANVGFAAAIANLTAANADVVAAHRRGLGFAVLQLLVTLGGALGPWLIGLASDATGSLRWAYTVVLLPLVIGSLIVLDGQRTYQKDAAAALGSDPVSDSA